MRTQLLAALKEADDYISGQELCEHFGVSRTAIWKAVKQLKEAGYVIEAVQNKGYKIVSTPDCLNTAELESIRKTKWAGREIFYFDTIDSTNTKAKQLAEEGHPTGTLVVAEKQEAGRGRRGRGFESPAGGRDIYDSGAQTGFCTGSRFYADAHSSACSIESHLGENWTGSRDQMAERYCDERQKSLWNLNGDERTVRLYQPCCHRYRY